MKTSTKNLSSKAKQSQAKQSQAKQSQARTMPTVALLAIVAVVAVGFVWYTMQSRSNDMFGLFGFGRTQAATTQAATTQQRITPAQYQADFVKASKSHLLVDVRTPEEFASGHIPGAINISLQSLPQRMQELPKDQPIVLYCRSGNRSNTATQMLARAGYADLYDLGGIITWANQGLPIQ